jgi:hypothetical protein
VRKPMRSLLFLAALNLIGAATSASAAKPATGALTGIVLNTKGAPVPAARVFWEAVDGSVPHTLRADSTGHFRVPQLRPGLYEVRGESGGMWSEWEHNVLVRAGSDGKVTLHLARKTPPAAPPSHQ